MSAPIIEKPMVHRLFAFRFLMRDPRNARAAIAPGARLGGVRLCRPGRTRAGLRPGHGGRVQLEHHAARRLPQAVEKIVRHRSTGDDGRVPGRVVAERETVLRVLGMKPDELGLCRVDICPVKVLRRTWIGLLLAEPFAFDLAVNASSEAWAAGRPFTEAVLGRAAVTTPSWSAVMFRTSYLCSQAFVSEAPSCWLRLQRTAGRQAACRSPHLSAR